jgi:predicted amidohydrolase
MVNSVGTCEGKPAGGNSMVIDAGGKLVQALNASEQALLLHDLKRASTRKLALDTAV